MSWEVGNYYIQELKKLKIDLVQVVVREILITNSQKIIEYYQNAQISKGLKKGSKKSLINIGYYKSTLTQDFWEQYWFPQQPPTDKYKGFVVDLKWTGDFYEGMYIVINKNGTYEIFSNDVKTTDLVQKYGDIFSLAFQVAFEIEKSYIAPKFNSELEKRLSAIV
jgi:hypothetical protein